MPAPFRLRLLRVKWGEDEENEMDEEEAFEEEGDEENKTDEKCVNFEVAVDMLDVEDDVFLFESKEE
jgi:hypothetical protein